MSSNTNIYGELQIACAAAGVTVSKFAKSLGKSHTHIMSVAKGTTKSKTIREHIKKFIETNFPDRKPVVEKRNTKQHTEYLSTKELARILMQHPASIANACNKGRYKTAIKDGKIWLIHKSEVPNER
ncbi:DNA-binding protein [bacterium]|nr:MAG: DNA-binding protein [bacterium]